MGTTPRATAEGGRQIGQRGTRQREAILRILSQARGPLNAPRILALAQAEVERIGIATVYRTLRLLESGGEIRPVALPTGEVQWETADRDHHHHFLCRECGTVKDLPGCPLHIGHASVPAGHLVESHEITLVGLCPRCRKAAGAKGARKTAQ